jgi:hypothetical protein
MQIAACPSQTATCKQQINSSGQRILPCKHVTAMAVQFGGGLRQVLSSGDMAEHDSCLKRCITNGIYLLHFNSFAT